MDLVGEILERSNLLRPEEIAAPPSGARNDKRQDAIASSFRKSEIPRNDNMPAKTCFAAGRI
jgi:hypothetical protein